MIKKVSYKPIGGFRVLFIIISLALFNCSVSSEKEKLLLSYYHKEIKLEPERLESIIEENIRLSQENFVLALSYFLKGVEARKNGRSKIDQLNYYIKAQEYLSNSDKHDDYLISAIYRNQGAILYDFQMYKRSIDTYEKAVDPSFTHSKSRGISTKFNIGRTLSKQDPEKALRLFIDLIKEAEEDVVRVGRIYNEIGLIFKRAENYEEALYYYNKGLELNVNNRTRAHLNQNIAEVHHHLKDYQKQEEYLKKALEIPEGNHFIALLDLGECYILQDRKQEALSALLKAEKLYPEQSQRIEYIKLYKWLEQVADNPVPYMKKQIEELEKYNKASEEIKNMMSSMAIKSVLEDAEKDKAHQATLAQIWKYIRISSFFLLIVSTIIVIRRHLLRKELAKILKKGISEPEV